MFLFLLYIVIMHTLEPEPEEQQQELLVEQALVENPTNHEQTHGNPMHPTNIS
jgi:hypothetical protein